MKMKIENVINKFINKLKRKNELRGIRNYKNIDYTELKQFLKTTNTTVIDVRSPQEFAEERIDFAINIPLYDLEKYAKNILNDKASNIVVYCQSGSRSKKACEILVHLGYENVYNLMGGINSFRENL